MSAQWLRSRAAQQRAAAAVRYRGQKRPAKRPLGPAAAQRSAPQRISPYSTQHIQTLEPRLVGHICVSPLRATGVNWPAIHLAV